jgi:hypothetical protein
MRTITISTRIMADLYNVQTLLLTEQQFSTACTASFYEHHHDLHLHRD